MEIIEQYDTVLLADGQTGCVVEILGDQDIFLVDIGSSPKDWDNIEVKRKDIKRILEHNRLP